MGSKMKRLVGCVIVFILLFGVCVYLHMKLNDEDIVPKGNMEYGIFDESGKIMDTGSTVKGKNIKHSFKISHNLDYERDYMLLAFMDFKQKNFKVNGVMQKNYPLKLVKINSEKIDIEIKNDGASELDYVILQFPSCKRIDDGDFDKALKIQNVFTLRFNLDNSRTLEENEYDNEKIIMNEKIMENVAFAKDVGKFEILTKAKKVMIFL